MWPPQDTYSSVAPGPGTRRRAMRASESRPWPGPGPGPGQCQLGPKADTGRVNSGASSVTPRRRRRHGGRRRVHSESTPPHLFQPRARRQRWPRPCQRPQCSPTARAVQVPLHHPPGLGWPCRPSPAPLLRLGTSLPGPESSESRDLPILLIPP